MGARDLAEGILPSEAIVALWYDDELHEIGLQYGYVVVSMPVEDYHEFISLLQQAAEKLEDKRGGSWTTPAGGVRHGRKG
jgi:hypothetical protein